MLDKIDEKLSTLENRINNTVNWKPLSVDFNVDYGKQIIKNFATDKYVIASYTLVTGDKIDITSKPTNVKYVDEFNFVDGMINSLTQDGFDNGIYSYDLSDNSVKIKDKTITTISKDQTPLFNINGTNIVSIYSIFEKCEKLTSIDISNWNTSNITTMNNVFQNCKSLTTIDLSNWNTSNVTNIDQMFNSCLSLTTLDVSNWEINDNTSMNFTFAVCEKLITIKCTEATWNKIKNSWDFPSPTSWSWANGVATKTV